MPKFSIRGFGVKSGCWIIHQNFFELFVQNRAAPPFRESFIQKKASDPNPLQPQNAGAQHSEHPLDLVLLSFPEDNFHQRRTSVLQHPGLRALAEGPVG